MKKRIYKFCLVVLVFFTGIIISGEKTINYDADEIIMLDNGNIVILKNSVIFKSNDFNITSSNAEINTELKLFKALNSVILKRGNNTINGDSIYFYYEEEKGIVFGGDSHIDKGYFYGEKITSINDNLLKISNGHFTTCDSVRNPHYKIFGSNITYYENDRIQLMPAILYLRNVPVFALPFAMIPAASTRKSGFLMPDIGYDAVNGFYIRNLTYFWALNDFSDMTFASDLVQNRGVLVNYELRVLVKPYVVFNLYSSIAFENINKRWSIKGDYSHKLPYEIYLKSKWDIISDISIFSDYTDTSIVELKRTTQTFLSLSKKIGKYSPYIAVNHNENFADNTLTMTLPKYRGYISQIKLFSIKTIIPNGLNYNHSHEFSNNYRYSLTDTLKYYMVSVNNSFNTYYKLFKFFNLKPNTSFSYYRNSDLMTSKGVLSAGTNFNTQVYGTSVFGFLGFSKFRHTFLPGVSFKISRNMFMDYSSIDQDSTTDTKTASFSISNNFEGKRNDKIKMLLKNSNSISYNFNTDSLNPLSSNISILSSYPITSTASIRYNIYTKDITYSINSHFHEKLFNPLSDKKIDISVNSSIDITEDSIIKNQLSGSSTMQIGNHLNVRMSLLYDLISKEIVSSQVSLNRDLHCWKAAFSVSTYGEIFKYDFSLSLKEMPDIAIDKDLLAPLFLQMQ